MSNTIYSDQIKVNCPLICDESGYFHLVYQITNLVNGKVYVGKHSTKDPYDDYLGSGKRIGQAIKKYGIENFTKEILFCFDKESDAFLKEEELVTQEFVDREDTYNLTLGGNGWQSGENNPMHGKTGASNPMFGKKHSQDTRNKMSKNHADISGTKNPMYGKMHSQETLDKISNILKGKMAGEKNPMYGRRGENSPVFGEKNPKAKTVLKLDESGNIITEYGCMKYCCEQEHMCKKTLRKYIKEHILYNGFYFEYKSKD